jgi:DNA anti-recombination protein RmuC
MRFFYLLLLSAFLMFGCVASDQYQVLENRVAAIERENNRQASLQKSKTSDLDRLQADMEKSSKATRENYAEVKSDIQQLKQKFLQAAGAD